MARETDKSSAPRKPKRAARASPERPQEDAQALNAIERARAAIRTPSKGARSEPVGRAPKEAAKTGARTGAVRADSPSQGMPDEIRERFIGIGSKYYFPDGAAAFTDHGPKLTTRSENTEVIRSLVAIAQERQWQEIKVTGTERFRKEAWFAARLAGLEVRGYTPTEFEAERVVRAIARREAGAAGREAEGPATERGRETGPKREGTAAASAKTGGLGDDGPITGRLVDHGRATYRHDPKEPMSYYVRIETPRGDREIWGVDIERAFRESLSRPTIGDDITARSRERDPVKVSAQRRDAEGRVIGNEEIATHRNRWIIERSDFLTERAAAAQTFRDATVSAAQGVKSHPELSGSYLQLQAAKLGAERDIRDPEDQAIFIARARAAIAQRIERGEPLEPVRIREGEVRTPEQEQRRIPEPAPTR
jgi:putative DNA primase/helicase